MTRLSGIQILVLGVVLWGLAVWLLDAPSPSSAQTPAATETAASEASAGTAAERPTGASGSDQGATAGTAVAPASSGSAPTAGSASLQAGSASGADAAATASSVPPAVASTAAPEHTTATGDDSHLALAPATAGSPPSDVPLTGAGPGAGSPMPPLAPEAGRARNRTGGSEIPPWAWPSPWLEHPELRPPPPFGARGGVTGGSAVAGQINAARRAAWEGRLADAVAHYRAAARLQPDHHVVWGEMGNVLWAMRRWSEAAYALEGAATLLVRAGELRAASELVPAVGRIDPDAAYRIQRLLFAAAQRQAG